MWRDRLACSGMPVLLWGGVVRVVGVGGVGGMGTWLQIWLGWTEPCSRSL